MVDRHPPQEILIKMQPVVMSASAVPASGIEAKAPAPKMAQQPQPDLTVEKIKADIEKIDNNFPRVPPGAQMQTLTDTEFKKLVMATNEYEKERVFNLITALQAQLKEHQSLLERLDQSEAERKKLVERNAQLEEENAEKIKSIEDQEERLQSLEGEVIRLKLDLANEKGMVDYANLTVHQLSVRNKSLESENHELMNRLSTCVENEGEVVRTDFQYRQSSKASKALLSVGKGRRLTGLSGELVSSTRTAFTEASTASASSQVSGFSDGFLYRSITQSNSQMKNIRSTSVMTESSEESHTDCIPERNLVTMTRSWVSEKVMRPNESRENKFGYY